MRVDVEQAVHQPRHVVGRGDADRGHGVAYDVGLLLVAADVVERVIGLPGAVLEDRVQPAHEFPVYWVVGVVEHPPERGEVVSRLDGVVDPDALRAVGGEGARGEYLRGLLGCEGRSLHVVGVPGELQLGGHVDAVGVSGVAFPDQPV